jgi:hypothetical protein
MPRAARRASSGPERSFTGTPIRLDGGDELARVLGVANRRGGQNVDAADAQLVDEGAETADRRQRRRHRVVMHAAVDRYAAAKAAQGLLVEKLSRRAAQPFIDDEPNRVGSDVDDGDRRAVIKPAGRIRPLRRVRCVGAGV